MTHPDRPSSRRPHHRPAPKTAQPARAPEAVAPETRRVVFGVAGSLDHFIARPDHGVDWLLWCDEAAELMSALWRTTDTILMGRKTYEVARARYGGRASGSSGPFAAMKTYVLSRTLAPDPRLDRGVEIVARDAVEFVGELVRSEGKDIVVMGGGELARPLLEAGLIDEIGLNVHPVLLGAGIPLFHGFGRQIELELIECRPFRNGCVYLAYRVR